MFMFQKQQINQQVTSLAWKYEKCHSGKKWGRGFGPVLDGAMCDGHKTSQHLFPWWWAAV